MSFSLVNIVRGLTLGLSFRRGSSFFILGYYEAISVFKAILFQNHFSYHAKTLRVCGAADG